MCDSSIVEVMTEFNLRHVNDISILTFCIVFRAIILKIRALRQKQFTSENFSEKMKRSTIDHFQVENFNYIHNTLLTYEKIELHLYFDVQHLMKDYYKRKTVDKLIAQNNYSYNMF